MNIVPNNIEAEKALINCILLDNNLLDEVASIIKASDFYRQGNGIIYSAMIDLHNKNAQIDMVTLGEYLSSKQLLDKAGGILAITEISNIIPSPIGAKNYAEIVRTKSVQRKILKATEVIRSLTLSDKSTDEILDEAEKIIMSISNGISNENIYSIQELLLLAHEDIEQRTQDKTLRGLETGFEDVDNVLKGIQNSDLVIIAARPAMGKTAFALNIATNFAKKNIPTLFFSLEMSSMSLTERLISSEAIIEADNIKTGNFTDDNWGKLNTFADKVYKTNMPLYIADTPGISILKIRSVARRMVKNKGVKAIFIDYLQLISSNEKAENRQYEISMISRELKNLARELDIPVIVLSQLSRDVEKRQDKHPILSDLRESGAIEQDADIVMFLYRDDYYNPSTDGQNIVDISIAKNRKGSIGTPQVFYHKNFLRFQNLAKP